jgi:hypothetical protein
MQILLPKRLLPKFVDGAGDICRGDRIRPLRCTRGCVHAVIRHLQSLSSQRPRPARGPALNNARPHIGPEVESARELLRLSIHPSHVACSLGDCTDLHSRTWDQTRRSGSDRTAVVCARLRHQRSQRHQFLAGSVALFDIILVPEPTRPAAMECQAAQVALGIVGGIVVGWIMRMLGFYTSRGLIPSILIAILGAVVLVSLARMFKKAWLAPRFQVYRTEGSWSFPRFISTKSSYACLSGQPGDAPKHLRPGPGLSGFLGT